MLTRMLTTGVISTLFIIIFGCSFQEPVLPTWQVPVRIPLSEKTFSLGEEIINDSTIVAQGEDSVLYISLSGDVGETRLEPAELAIGPVDSSFSFTIDTLELNSFGVIRSQRVRLRDLFPGWSYLVGQTVTVPDTTLIPFPLILASEDFQKLKLVGGTLRVRLINDLPFPLGPNSANPEGVTISAINDSLNQSFSQVSFPQVLNPGSTGEEWDQVNSEGTWIYSRIRLEYVLPVAMPTTFEVTDSLLDNSGFYFELVLENLKATEAVARIEPQSLHEYYTIEIESENKIRQATIESGQIQLDFQNNTPLVIHVFFTFPNLQTPNQNIFVDSLQLSPFSPLKHIINLDGFQILRGVQEGDFMDEFAVDITSKTEATTELVSVSSEDNASVAVSTDSIYFEQFDGYLEPVRMELDPVVAENIADYGGLDQGIQLVNAALSLNLFNEYYLDSVYASYRIRGYHVGEDNIISDSAEIVVADQKINPGLPGEPGETVLQLTGNEISDFLNILPTRIKAFGEVVFGGNAFVQKNARIWGRYEFATPMQIEIRNATPIQGTVQVLNEKDVDADFRDAASEDIGEAHLRLSVENGTPLGGEIWVIISADPQHADLYDEGYFNPQLEIRKSIALEPAPVDPQTGLAQSPSANEIEIGLSRQEIQIFRQTPLRVGYQLNIADTGGPVFVRASDFVTISGVAEVSMFVKDK